MEPSNVGYPIKIIESLPESQTLKLKSQMLGQILLSDQIRDKPIVTICIGGDYRQGKSFILNFFIKCLSEKNFQAWMSDPENEVNGFTWKNGESPCTIGVDIWAEPFLVTGPSGKEMAILLIDAQGLFNGDQDLGYSSVIFAFLLLTSSIFLYNIQGNIQQSDLDNLTYFTELGRLVSETTDSKPFQHLVFLVRDWSYPYEFEYGFEGGKKLLANKLQVKNSDNKSVKSTKDHLYHVFKKIDAFLLPHPGLHASQSNKFTGKLKELTPDFLIEVKNLVTQILDSSNLVTKVLNDVELTGKDLYELMTIYMISLQEFEYKSPSSMLHILTEANNRIAVNAAKRFIFKEIEDLCGGDEPYNDWQSFIRSLKGFKNQSLKIFESYKKMAGSEFSDRYDKELYEDLSKMVHNFLKQNMVRKRSKFNATVDPLTDVQKALYSTEFIALSTFCDIFFYNNEESTDSLIPLFLRNVLNIPENCTNLVITQNVTTFAEYSERVSDVLSDVLVETI